MNNGSAFLQLSEDKIMPESELHKRARQVLRPGDRVGQPYGEALEVLDTVDSGNVQIKDGPAAGRSVDTFVEAPEGYRVAVEFNYKHKVGPDKIAELKKDGRYPVLEVDLSEWLANASDDELRQYIAGHQKCNRFNRGWLYLPSWDEILRQFASEQNSQAFAMLDNTNPFGCLRCCVPGCKGQVSSGVGDAESHYRTLPRFACADHMLAPGVLTHPEGVQAFASPDTTGK